MASPLYKVGVEGRKAQADSRRFSQKDGGGKHWRYRVLHDLDGDLRFGLRSSVPAVQYQFVGVCAGWLDCVGGCTDR